MKKMLFAVLFVAIFGLVGCGNNDSANGENKKESKNSSFNVVILDTTATSDKGADYLLATVIINGEVRIIDIDRVEIDKSVNQNEITSLKGMHLTGKYSESRGFSDLLITK